MLVHEVVENVSYHLFQVFAVQGDVRDPVAVASALDAVEAELGLPHIVINNAAGNFISPFERLSPNAFKTVVDIVLLGTANVTLDVGKRLIKAKQGMLSSCCSHYRLVVLPHLIRGHQMIFICTGLYPQNVFAFERLLLPELISNDILQYLIE